MRNENAADEEHFNMPLTELKSALSGSGPFLRTSLFPVLPGAWKAHHALYLHHWMMARIRSAVTSVALPQLHMCMHLLFSFAKIYSS
jgi:hypothetical protein